MIYTELIRFLLPLVLTLVIQELGGQVLNGGMARMPRATETLAAFGLAWGLVNFLISPLLQARQLGLVLVDGRQAFKRVQWFVLLSGLLLGAILTSLALSPLGDWVIEDLHGAGQSLATVARTALLWLIPVPLFRGIALFYSGLLIRTHRTGVVSLAMFVSMGASILAVFALAPAGFVQARPILLPILVTYAGISAELVIILWGSRRHTGHLREGGGAHLSFGYVLRFFWPLALIMAIQGLSRPLINLFVTREPGGAAALAVLTIVYTLGHLPYGWLNEIRNLPSAFRDSVGSLYHIRRFALGCGLVSFGIMVLLFWTPIRDYVLGTLIGVDPGLATQAVVPLVIFSFFPLVVMARAYLHGVGLLEHRTQAMAPSAPARVVAILAALVILPTFGVHGATRGVAALLCGFMVETTVVWWGIRGRDAWSTRPSEERKKLEL
jgi:hypothetical protein